MTWIHRLYLMASTQDVGALTQLAFDTTMSQAEQYTFHQVLPGYYGCNTAANEEIRQSLNDGLSLLLANETIGTIYIARLENGTDILQASYTASPNGHGTFGGIIGEVWSFDDAVHTLAILTQ